LRSIANQNTIHLDAAQFPTARTLLAELVRRFPQMESHLLDLRGNIRQDLPIFINGRNPRLQSHGIDCMLEEDDIISLFTPIASGRLNVEVLRDN
jgi:molybdopterin converting factor small subunit